jgi:hypothetical protein
MRFVGKSKIGRLSAKMGKTYAQIRLPPQCADTIGEIADIFETKHNGKRAFLVVTPNTVLDNNTVLQPSESVVKPCDDVALPLVEVAAKNLQDPELLSEAQTRSKPEEKPLSFIPRLVSCALCNRLLCTCPGSVAAYHGALSRLRLGFKSRLGRFIFA